MNVHLILDYATRAVAIASALHTGLPPWDWKPDFVEKGLEEFPLAQKIFYSIFNNRWYRLLVYVIGYVAINARSTVWKYISINNPKGPNANVGSAPGQAASGGGTPPLGV